MKYISYAFFVACVAVHARPLHAMEKLTLQSNDGYECKISKQNTQLFGTLHDLSKDVEDLEGQTIPLGLISGDVLQTLINDIPQILAIHREYNNQTIDYDAIKDLSQEEREQRARSATYSQELPAYSPETLRANISYLRGADYLSAPESRQKYANIVVKLLVSNASLRAFHEHPTDHPIFNTMPHNLESELYRSMPPVWANPLEIPHNSVVFSVAFSPDSTMLATGSSDHKARIIDPQSGIVLRTIQHGGWAYSVAFSPNNNFLATGSSDHKAQMIGLQSGKAVRTIEHGNSVESVAFSPDNKFLATGSVDNKARIIDICTGNVQHMIPHGGCVHSVAFSPDSTMLATGSDDKMARIIDPRTATVRRTILHGSWVTAIAFSPDNSMLATGCCDRKARIIDPQSGIVLRSIEHGSWIRCVAFSSNSTMLATGSDDNMARIIDPRSGIVVRSIPHRDSVYSVAFSPDSTTLATGSADKMARLVKRLPADTFNQAFFIQYLKWCHENKQPWQRTQLMQDIVNSYDRSLIRVLRNSFPEMNLKQDSSLFF